MPYAIVRCGGKQVRVAEGETVRVEKIAQAVGQTVELSEVLLLHDGKAVHVGRPRVAGAKVVGEVVVQARAKKLTIFRDMMRKGIRRRAGHRQPYTEIKIQRIVNG